MIDCRMRRLFFFCLCQLLFDEEVPQVRQLPGAGDAEDAQLNQRPPDDFGVGGLTLVSEFRLTFLKRKLSVGVVLWYGLYPTYPLKDLFPPDVGQPPVQLLDLGHDAVDLGLVLALDLARLADGHVDGQLDPAHGHAAGAGEPASQADRRVARGREADSVQTGVGRTESKLGRAVRRRRLLRHHAVVVVKRLLDRDLDLEIGRDAERLRLAVVGFGFVCS